MACTPPVSYTHLDVYKRQDTVTALENTLAAYCDDRNGDGKVVVELVQYSLDFDSESENTDAYTQMADVTRLSADLSSEDGPYIFIMQDTDYAQQFAETTGDLQYQMCIRDRYCNQ